MNKKLPDPIQMIRFRMDQMNWKQSDLVKAGCGSRSHVSEMLNYKRKITLHFIRAYHKIADATPLESLIKDYKLK
jgi:HTH-type transcriptional regulator/antitoxin HigA